MRVEDLWFGCKFSGQLWGETARPRAVGFRAKGMDGFRAEGLFRV